MNSKIQQLTETIYNEGIQKAREEADTILDDAKKRASSIEKEARREADKVMANAQSKAMELKKQVDSEIKMTFGQAVSALKQEITSLISMKVIEPSVDELFANQAYLQQLITEVVRGWSKTESTDFQVILSEQQRTQMEQYFKNNLASELNQGMKVSFTQKIKSGFKIGPADGSYLISFTDEDFINFLKGYLRPKTSQLLFEESQ